MKKIYFFLIVIFICLIANSCVNNKNGTDDIDNFIEREMPVINFPFPQRDASIATYEVKPLLPSDMAGAEAKMINLFKDILNNNLIFDSRMPLNPDEFRVVLEHHTSYPRTGHSASANIHEEHITVSESMGYGMILLVYMAGSEEALTEAGHIWRFGATSLKDYYDGMLRTVLDFQSPLHGRNSRQHSWELFGYNTGINETGLFINDSNEVRTRGFRYTEESPVSAKIAPFANTPGGSPEGGGGSTGYYNNGTSSAADGDMDIIYSLIAADKQWGRSGRYDYLGIALEMLEGFYNYVVHRNYKSLLLGDWAFNNNPQNDLQNSTRPSDFILSHLFSYRAVDGDRWDKVINATLEAIYHVRDDLHSGITYSYSAQGAFREAQASRGEAAPNNGLLPDFMYRHPERTGDRWIPAYPSLLEGNNDGRYAWNSFRTPWRLGTSYLLYGDIPMPGGRLSNPSLYTYSIKPLNDFARARTGSGTGNASVSRGLASSAFNLDSPLSPNSTNSSSGAGAPFLVTAAAVGNSENHANAQEWVDAFWNIGWMHTFANDWFQNYYKLICMITASGNYWKPEAM